MEQKTAETIVKVYAVLAWIEALLIVIGAMVLLFVGTSARMFGLRGVNELTTELSGTLLVVLAIFLVALAIFMIFVGIGLWKLQPWSRIAAIVLSVLALFSFPIGTIIGAFGIWLFGFEPAVTGLFKPAPAKAQLAPKRKRK